MKEREFPFVVQPLSKVLQSHPGFKPEWRRGEGSQVLFNPDFGEIRHVVVCDRSTGNPLWDQPVHIEPVGSITIPVTKEGKIRLQEQPRPIPLPDGIPATFPEGLPEACWGRWFLDVPRGFPKKGENPQRVSLRETFEETASPVIRIEKIGEVNANASFFAHMIPVFVAEIDEDFAGKPPEDANERILPGEDYSREEVVRLIGEGKIQDALSLAALALYLAKTE